MVSSYCLVVTLVSCFLIEGVVSQCEFATACVADVTDDDCGDGEVMVPFGGLFQCCPGCRLSSGNTTILPINFIHSLLCLYYVSLLMAVLSSVRFSTKYALSTTLLSLLLVQIILFHS